MYSYSGIRSIERTLRLHVGFRLRLRLGAITFRPNYCSPKSRFNLKFNVCRLIFNVQYGVLMFCFAVSVFCFFTFLLFSNARMVPKNRRLYPNKNWQLTNCKSVTVLIIIIIILI